MACVQTMTRKDGIIYSIAIFTRDSEPSLLDSIVFQSEGSEGVRSVEIPLGAVVVLLPNLLRASVLALERSIAFVEKEKK
jgi:hypothetical protein